MVKSYNEYSNHNMRRPIVKPEIVGLMRGEQKALTGFLAEVETFAHAENSPVIPHETVVYFQFLLQALQPKKILEVGTASACHSQSIARIRPTQASDAEAWPVRPPAFLGRRGWS